MKRFRYQAGFVGGAFLVAALLLSSCGGGATTHGKVEPAKVENPTTEKNLATIVLSEEAEKRLGVETAVVARNTISSFMELGGETIAPPGGEVKVSAPVAGTVMYISDEAALCAGAEVRRGREMMRLFLLPADKDLVGTWEDVAVTQVTYDVAKAKLERSERLLKDDAISERAYEEAKAELALADASLKAAKAKLKLLRGTDLDPNAIDQSTLVLKAPIDGVVTQVYVASGQTVPASTALFTIAGQKPVWVRVPVYSGHVAEIDLEEEAVVHSLGWSDLSASVSVPPVTGPPLSDADSASSFFYYRYGNEDRRFRIGERVRVQLTLKAQADSLAIPLSSIIYDIYGGTWVYLKTAPLEYSRRRVEIGRIADGAAVIRRGVHEGDVVVTAAAAELYGTEFGSGK